MIFKNQISQVHRTNIVGLILSSFKTINNITTKINSDNKRLYFTVYKIKEKNKQNKIKKIVTSCHILKTSLQTNYNGNSSFPTIKLTILL